MARLADARVVVKPRGPDPNETSPIRVIGIAFCLFLMLSGMAVWWLGGLPFAERSADDDSRSSAPAGGRSAAADVQLALQKALERNDIDAAARAIAALPDAAIDENYGGMTPLMRAASHGERDLVQALLARGADPNARGRGRRTALQYAAERNRISAAEALLNAGADVNGHDNGRLTPLIMAADRNFTQLGLLLLQHGADVGIVHKQGWTALIDAARHGNLPLVDALLAHGADPAVTMPSGHSAVDYARHNGHAAVVKRIAGHVAVRAGREGTAANAKRAAQTAISSTVPVTVPDTAAAKPPTQVPELLRLLVAGTYVAGQPGVPQEVSLTTERKGLRWRDPHGTDCAARLVRDGAYIAVDADCVYALEGIREMLVEWSGAGTVQGFRAPDGRRFRRVEAAAGSTELSTE